jgi:hypothetical protein
LDGKFGPWWVNRIDLGVLDLRSSEYCVLGQVMGREFLVIKDAMRVWEMLSVNAADEWMRARGFDLPWVQRQVVDDLTAEWVRVIQERRAVGTAAR